MKAKPTVANTSIVSANTEYSYELPAHTKEFKLKLRDPGYPLKIAMISGESGTTYRNLANGQTWHKKGLKSGTVTLYFQSTAGSMVVEILSWK